MEVEVGPILTKTGTGMSAGEVSIDPESMICSSTVTRFRENPGRTTRNRNAKGTSLKQ